MPQRQLGKNGPKVEAIGFGAMGLSIFYGTPASDEERFKVLDRAIELGSTHIDASDLYGDNEDLLGKYFKKYPQQRRKVFLASKFAGTINPDGSYLVRGDVEYVHQAIEQSLSLLQLPYVDLYYVHRIDPKTANESFNIGSFSFIDKFGEKTIIIKKKDIIFGSCSVNLTSDVTNLISRSRTIFDSSNKLKN